MMRKIYSKLAGVIGVGQTNFAAEREFLVLAHPGILVDPSIDADTKPEDRQRLARIVLDRVLLPSALMQRSTLRTVDIYGEILRYKELPDARRDELGNWSQLKLSPEKEVELKAAKEYLAKHEEEWRLAMLEWSRLQDKVLAAWRDNPETGPSNELEAQRLFAKQKFDALSNEVYPHQQTRDAVAGIDPKIWWQELQSRFLQNTDDVFGARVPRYSFYPKYKRWTDASLTWEKINFKQSDLEQTLETSHSKVGGSAGINAGLFSFGGSYEKEEGWSHFSVDAKDIDVTLEVMRVEIDRPWMDSLIFRSPAWRLGSLWNHAEKVVSDGGDIASASPPRGVMPLLPTALLLARKLKVSASWGTKIENEYNSRVSTGANIGWGPFSIGGRYSAETGSQYLKASVTENGIEFGDPQILGMFVEVLPVCPSADANWHFPSQGPIGPVHLLLDRLHRGDQRIEGAKAAKAALEAQGK